MSKTIVFTDFGIIADTMLLPLHIVYIIIVQNVLKMKSS